MSRCTWVWHVCLGVLASLAPACGVRVSDGPGVDERPVPGSGTAGREGHAPPVRSPGEPMEPGLSPATGGSGDAAARNAGPGPSPIRPGDAARMSEGVSDAGPLLPASGAGLMISGTFVPKEKIIVLLHFGHSNMAGRALEPSALKPFFFNTDAALWSQRWTNQIAATGPFVLVPAKEPTAPDSATGSAAGPGMALLRTAQAMATPDIHFVSIGRGQSGTAGGVCVGYRKGGLVWDIVMKPAIALKGKVTFGGIFTMLGITENHTSAAEMNGFSDCMKAIAQEIRQELGDPEIPFLVGDFEHGQRNAKLTADFVKLITAQLKAVPGKVTRSALIPTEGLTYQDQHHYDMAGHKLWAERALELVAKNGWGPWLRAAPL